MRYITSLLGVKYRYILRPMKKNIIHLVIALPLILLSHNLYSKGSKPPKEPTPCKTNYLPCSYEIFWKALQMTECHPLSREYPRCRHLESSGEWSLGPFQLSLGDAQRYGCDFKTEEDIYDFTKSEHCKFKIERRLEFLYPNESYQRRYGRYWGPLRCEDWGADQRHKACSNFKKHAASLGCFID